MMTRMLVVRRWRVRMNWSSASSVSRATWRWRRRRLRNFGASVRATSETLATRRSTEQLTTSERLSSSTSRTSSPSVVMVTTAATAHWWELMMAFSTTGASSVLCCSLLLSTLLSVCAQVIYLFCGLGCSLSWVLFGAHLDTPASTYYRCWNAEKMRNGVSLFKPKLSVGPPPTFVHLRL